jgi:uncharacterized protein (DUF433 family)
MGLYHQTRPGGRRHGCQTAEYPIGDAKVVDLAKKAIGDATTDAEKASAFARSCTIHRAVLEGGRGCGPKASVMSWQDRLTLDSKVLIGKPVIKRTRIAVEFVIDLLGRDWTTEQILREYDDLSPQDIQACLACASEVLKSERVYLLPT